MSAIRRVLIVGAGIAGQTLALALARRGVACEIVEVKRDFDILGAGMYVQGNALRAFLDIGIVAAIVGAGWWRADDAWQMTDAEGGLLARAVTPRLAGADIPSTVTIRRQALHDILHAAVIRAAIPLRMGTTVTALAEAPDGSAVEARFSDGSAGRYDLVAGCDGIRSTVRDLVFGRTEPQFSGFANWRVILERPPGIDMITWMQGDGTTFGIVPIAADYLYIAGVSKEPGNPRYERRDLPALLHRKFAEYGGPARSLLAAVRRPEQIVYTPIDEVIQPAPWHRGRVVILGDAAHASTPFWAQGASMAVEDAVLLAALIGSFRPAEQILPEWMARRHRRCLFVQHGSRETGEKSHREGSAAVERMQDSMRRHLQATVDARYAGLAEPI